MEHYVMPDKVSNFQVIDLPKGIGIKYSNHLHTLNPTAYEIFLLCNGKRTVMDIYEEMQYRYPGCDVVRHVDSFLQILCSVGLIRE